MTRLEVPADLWWRGPMDGRLVIDATRVEPGRDEDGTVTWVVVEGWQILPDGTRRRTRDLVRAAALPPELVTWNPSSSTDPGS